MADEVKQPSDDTWSDELSEEGGSNRPAPDGFDSWNDYWTKKHNQPWRTEPEIREERQRFLKEQQLLISVLATKPNNEREVGDTASLNAGQ